MLNRFGRSLSILSLGLALLLGACTEPPDEPVAPGPAAGDVGSVDEPAEGDDAAADEGGEDAMAAGDPERGEEMFTTCAACHGQDARGIEGLGKDLHNNEFVASRSDEELVEFLKTGRPSTHELNTTGVDMPPKGGNPALSDEDLLDIVAYMRTLDG